MANPMPTGGLDAVDHVIVLMQENRSFNDMQTGVQQAQEVLKNFQ
ncbi:hypothetical protein [Saccharopolyspora sp. NPDC049426]